MGLSHTPDQLNIADFNAQTEKVININDGDDNDGFSFQSWLEEHEGKKTIENIEKKHLALTWSYLTVTGVDSRTVLGHNVLSCVNPVELIADAKGSAGEIVRSLEYLCYVGILYLLTDVDYPQ